ncbi:zinc finger DHHC-type containing 19 [Chelydra serpentina]|uniref:Zinc finger DHHC-type containing 19 n=1 Tax=Chelydra serpentina TaxID=8475 RepID=A0A8T1RVB1_CHESE|nr:zinc finger DHHC-type containing 19 [Chelydra serpentina]
MIPAGAVPRWVLPSLFASFHFSSLVGLSSLFFSFPCSWLAVHVSLAFPLVAGILFIPAVANLLLASFTDPGILHRGAEGRAGLVIQALRVKESRFDLHWCQTCQYYCPPRTYHCPWCDVCVEVRPAGLRSVPWPGSLLANPCYRYPPAGTNTDTRHTQLRTPPIHPYPPRRLSHRHPAHPAPHPALHRYPARGN